MAKNLWEMNNKEIRAYKRRKLRTALRALDDIGSSPHCPLIDELWSMSGTIFDFRDAMRRALEAK